MASSAFRAAVLEELGQPLRILEIDYPQLCDGQVLVQLLYSGVCRSQLMEVQGERGNDNYLPHLLGHEGSGVVIAIGPGVTKVQPGQSVIIGWIRSTGISAPNPVFWSQGRRINAGPATTFSEMTVVSENRVYLKPEGVSDKAAVLFGCALLTGTGMVLNEMPPSKSDKIVVLGLGGVGMSALLGTLVVRPETIIAVDSSATRRNLALALGADFALDPRHPNFVQVVREITDGGADYCYESAGRTDTIELALDCVKFEGGEVLFASHPPAWDRIRLDPFDLIRGKKLRGSWGGGSQPDSDIPRVVSAVNALGIDLNCLLGSVFPLDRVNMALKYLETGVGGRPLINLQS